MTGELNQTFIVANQFDLYLEKSGLKQSEMSDMQYIETRRAFYAGFGQLLNLMLGPVADLNEDRGAQVLDGMLNEVIVFCNKERNL